MSYYHLSPMPSTDEPPWDELDEDIRGVVAWLWGHGFQTTDSGDGKKRGWKADMECVLDVPHVFMVCATDEMFQQTDKLRHILNVCQFTPEQAGLQATYLPYSGICTIELYGVTDEMLRSRGITWQLK